MNFNLCQPSKTWADSDKLAYQRHGHYHGLFQYAYSLPKSSASDVSMRPLQCGETRLALRCVGVPRLQRLHEVPLPPELVVVLFCSLMTKMTPPPPPPAACLVHLLECCWLAPTLQNYTAARATVHNKNIISAECSAKKQKKRKKNTHTLLLLSCWSS